MSEEKIVSFLLPNCDWMDVPDEEDCDSSTEEGCFLILPDSFNQWMSMECYKNGLQMVLKNDLNARDNALNSVESDWRRILEKHLCSLGDSFLPDITLEVGPEKTLFHVHKFVLAFGCDVFKAMFYGGLAEKGEKVCIPDVPPEGFKTLLSFLYGALIVVTNEEDAFNAWIAADKYCVEQLKEECQDFFHNCKISGKNIWKLLEVALFSNMEPLTSRCTNFIQKRTETALRNESFLEAKFETVKVLFELPTIRVTEFFLMESFLHWGKNQVKIGAARSLKKALGPLLPQFRFAVLTAEEFCKFLDGCQDLLDKSDALDILKHVTQPFSCPLPEWCLGIKWSRAVNLTERSLTQYQCLDKYVGYKKRKTKK